MFILIYFSWLVQLASAALAEPAYIELLVAFWFLLLPHLSLYLRLNCSHIFDKYFPCLFAQWLIILLLKCRPISAYFQLRLGELPRCRKYWLAAAIRSDFAILFHFTIRIQHPIHCHVVLFLSGSVNTLMVLLAVVKYCSASHSRLLLVSSDEPAFSFVFRLFASTSIAYQYHFNCTFVLTYF